MNYKRKKTGFRSIIAHAGMQEGRGSLWERTVPQGSGKQRVRYARDNAALLQGSQGQGIAPKAHRQAMFTHTNPAQAGDDM